MQGVLLVDKPKGWTSFDVVNYVRKIVAEHEGKKPKNCKVGHTGTLDPLATGLLVLLIGKEYTRKAQQLTKLDKTYEVTMKLGETSTTGDAEGIKTPWISKNVRGLSSHKIGDGDEPTGVKVPSKDEVLSALKQFMGEIMQKPPAYSAIKINGQKAYDLARKGQEVVLEPRQVNIYDLRDVSYDFPLISFTCDVSSGTYIRSLVEDIGNELETGAFMSDLRRTRVGNYLLSSAQSIKELDVGTLQTCLSESILP